MQSSRRLATLIVALATCLSLVHPAAARQEAPTAQQIRERIDDLQGRGDQLDDAGRAALEELNKALAFLTQAEESARRRAGFEAELAAVPEKTQEVNAELSQPQVDPKPEPPADATLSQLQQSFDEAKAQLEQAQKTLDDLQRERGERDTRLADIPRAIAEAQERLEAVETALATAPPVDQPAVVSEARRAALAAERHALAARIPELQAERANYEARRDLIPLRIQRAGRRVEQRQKLVQAWQALVDARRAVEIEQQQREAERARLRALDEVAPIAERNVALAQERDQVRQMIERIQPELEAVRGLPAELRTLYDNMEEKVRVGLTSFALGLYLRRQLADLPDVRDYRRRVRQMQDDLSTVEFEQLDYEDQFEALEGQVEKRVQEILAGVPESTPEERRADIESAARAELRLQLTYLTGLTQDLDDYFDRLQTLNQTSAEIVALTTRIRDYINQRILWIRSAAPLSIADVGESFEALNWLLSPSEWRDIGALVWADARGRWPALAVAALILGGLIGLRQWGRSRLHEIAVRISRTTKDNFAWTFEALVVTLAMAITWPLAMVAIAIWLESAAPASELAAAVSSGLVRAALVFFLLRLTRELCRLRGLGESHFRWSTDNTRLVRRSALWVAPILVPGTFIVSALNSQANDSYAWSLGRVVFIVMMIALAVLTRRLLSPAHGIVHEYIGRHRDGWLDRLRFVWHPLVVLVPLALAALSAFGYHYTATRLSQQLVESLALGIAVSILAGLLFRWLYIAHRRLAIEEARKRRAAAEAQSAAPMGEAALLPIEETHMDASAVSGQTRQLIRGLTIFTLLIGLWVIWADAVPALNMLRQVELWQRAGAAAVAAESGSAEVLFGGAAADAGAATSATDMTQEPAALVSSVTLADLLLAIVILIVTVIVSKNIPGLLEITILQRLPLEPGGQYAIATLLRYAISIVGVMIAFWTLGWTWSRLQWIAAAITVGLGFGLQEIFANFVSGLIILFERPIRVGDTVTVGDVNGTVTRIRMRAAVVTDWDRKEIVIPNKDFVTSRIINWTLSDPILRVVIPVGIAYGSDTTKAEKLLLKAARDNAMVLDDPPPTVIFNKFGDSSLEFVLRVFIPHIDHFLSIRHSLHNNIDQAFRKAGIEIAFPQRDIHIRSVAAKDAIKEVLG